MTSSLLSCTSHSFLKGGWVSGVGERGMGEGYSKRKEHAAIFWKGVYSEREIFPLFENKFFNFKVDIFSEGRQEQF